MSKSVFIATLVAIVLVSCEHNKTSFRFDTSTLVSFRPHSSGQSYEATETSPEHLTSIEIVEHCVDIAFWNRDISPDRPMGHWFSANERDTANLRLMMPGTAIVTQNRVLIPNFIGASDLVLRRITEPYPDLRYDTVAYIPNSIMREAEQQIRSSFANQDYDVVYHYFDQIFRFIPITGDQWSKLKAKGLN